ncbi:hypothetical protein RugamoR64_02890 [Duganella rhizosphaerae]
MLRIAAVFGTVLFFASLCFPVFDCRGFSSYMGYEVGEVGWLAILTLDPRWFANPLALLIVVSVVRGRPLRRASIYAVMILLAALSCLIVPAMACGSGAGGPEPSTGIRLGAYLWIAAMTVLAFVGFASQGAGQENGA